MVPIQEKIAIVQIYIHIVKDKQVDIQVPNNTDIAKLQLLESMYRTASYWLGRMGTIMYT